MQSLGLGFRVEPPEFYGSPKEVWGFRSEPVPGPVRAAARRFLAANSGLLKLHGVLGELRVRKVIPSLGARHVVFEQRHRRLRIHRAYVTVHLGRDDRIYLVKNRAVPVALLPERPRSEIGAREAVARAVRAVLGHSGHTRVLPGVEHLWYPLGATLRPAYRVRVEREIERRGRIRRREWIVFVDAVNRRILERYDNLALGPARPGAGIGQRGWGRVFDPHPVAAVRRWQTLVRDGEAIAPPERVYRGVPLRDLEGARGYLTGPRVTTSPTQHRIHRADRRFAVAASEPGFEEVMAYYHLDRAVRYVESLGYRGGLRIFRRRLRVDAARRGEEESWYSPGRRLLTFGTRGVDGAEDGETILHEFGHAVQDAICPDFGQSLQGAAMGEGFGDYFAASFFAERKPGRYRPCVMSWWAIEAASGDLAYNRRVDGRKTADAYDGRLDEHANGEIWSATLWEIRAALGRRLADRLILESHFQQDAFTTLARGGRAILDADANLYGGAHRNTLRSILAARRIGPI